MFNSNGTAYAAAAKNPAIAAIETRFLIWLNANGIPERYWIPAETGSDYELTPCLAPLKSLRDHVHVISGIDNRRGQAEWSGQRALQRTVRPHDRHLLHRSGSIRPFDRPAPRGQDRR